MSSEIKEGWVNPPPKGYRPPKTPSLAPVSLPPSPPADLAVPVGYKPYRIFNYDAPHVIFTMRPEQYVSAYMARIDPEADKDSRGCGAAPFDGPGLCVTVLLKDGRAVIPFDTVGSCRDFLTAIRMFMDADALRNAHNTIMRKGQNP